MRSISFAPLTPPYGIATPASLDNRTTSTEDTPAPYSPSPTDWQHVAARDSQKRVAATAVHFRVADPASSQRLAFSATALHRFLAVLGPKAKDLPVAWRTLTLGRSRSNDVLIDWTHKNVSRHHAKIIWDPITARMTVCDNATPFGTHLVNVMSPSLVPDVVDSKGQTFDARQTLILGRSCFLALTPEVFGRANPTTPDNQQDYRLHLAMLIKWNNYLKAYPTLIVGSDPQKCQFVIPDFGLAPQHFGLVKTPNGYKIEMYTQDPFAKLVTLDPEGHQLKAYALKPLQQQKLYLNSTLTVGLSQLTLPVTFDMIQTSRS